ncbi:hypothetical protein H6F78_17030 [Coleofasciculus sp. FACHB-64]|uniref:hypothetical protein n=1 Tax=Cyanophyceae TaxID=3028117 RepID=UPI00168906DD|nr:hypothetical protein [Coleofasciculus sp. FACHB-64]MBD2047275.1 hypothetical protein [Coleofasciculus sp. FACHB-64]
MTDIKTAIQQRIKQNQRNGIGFVEGQLLPRTACLETACTLAEYWSRGMDTEAFALINNLPSQRQSIHSIYSKCMRMKRK